MPSATVFELVNIWPANLFLMEEDVLILEWTRTSLINGRGANLCRWDALSNSVCADGWTLGIERFQNSIPAGIVDELAQSLGRRME